MSKWDYEDDLAYEYYRDELQDYDDLDADEEYDRADVDIEKLWRE